MYTSLYQVFGPTKSYHMSTYLEGVTLYNYYSVIHSYNNQLSKINFSNRIKNWAVLVNHACSSRIFWSRIDPTGHSNNQLFYFFQYCHSPAKLQHARHHWWFTQLRYELYHIGELGSYLYIFRLIHKIVQGGKHQLQNAGLTTTHQNPVSLNRILVAFRYCSLHFILK